MRPYRSNLGGAFGSGLSGQARQQGGIDVTSLLDALTGSGESLVRAAYMKKDIRRRDAQEAFERQQAEHAMARQTALDAEAAADRASARDAQREQQDFNRAKMQAEGYTPPGYAVTTVPDASAIRGTTVADAYRSHATQGAPGVGLAPQMAAPQLGAPPQVQVSPIAASYDPANGVTARMAAEKEARASAQRAAEAQAAHERAKELEGIRQEGRKRLRGMPTASSGGTDAAGERDMATEEAKILALATTLTKPEKDEYGGYATGVAPMPWEQAVAEATRRVRSVHGAARAGAGGGVADAAVNDQYNAAAQRISSGKATLEAALRSPSLDDAVKERLRQRFGARQQESPSH